MARMWGAGIHLGLSAGVATLAAFLVFGIWFPSAYRHMAGGQDLFVLLTSVDLILGPLLTFTVFDTRKIRLHLQRDLAVIAVLQIGAFLYGLVTVFQARPIALVFEKDRFQVVTAVQVNVPELDKALPAFRRLPLNGPWLLGSREPFDSERNEALFMALEGFDRAQRPVFWQPYNESVERVLTKSRPLADLLKQYPGLQNEVNGLLAEHQLLATEAVFLPLVARHGDWVAVLNGRGMPVLFFPANGFF